MLPKMARNWLSRFYTLRSVPVGEMGDMPKILFLDSVFLLAGIVAFAMGFVRLLANNPVLAAIDFLFAGFNISLLAYLHRYKDKVEIVSTLAITQCFILFFAIYLLEPSQTSRLSLFFLLCASVFFLKGRKIGRIWLIIIIITIAATHIFAPFQTAYTLLDIITYCVYLFAQFVILENYETFKEREEEVLREQEVLRQIEERWRLALEGSGDAIWDWDIKSDELRYSPRFAEMLGYGENELEHARSSLQRLVHPEDAPRTAAELEAYLNGGGGQYAAEQRFLCRDGSWKWVLSRGKVTLRDADERPLRMSGTHTDITERKQAEEEIRKLNKELEIKVQERTKQLLDAQEELVRKEKLAVLGQVAGIVGHELRNPLGVMNNAVYFLQTVLTDADETTKEYLNIIKDEIAGSDRIVSDLLDAVRAKPPNTALVGLEELIQQALEKCRVPSSVTVKLDIPKTLPPLRVDAMQIQQVFRNLISNGVDAMPEGGRLEISAVENKDDNTVTVRVQDSGTGIAPEVMEKLFQPLFTTKARGIGLGLVVVKNLIQANGGKVEVKSIVGKGSTFAVTLPAAG